ARPAARVAREVERPETPLTVDTDGEERLEMRRALLGLLEPGVRERHRVAVHQLGELERGVAVGMERQEDAPASRDRDVAGRVVEVGHDLERRGRELGRRRAVVEAPAATETATEAEEHEAEEEEHGGET